MKLLKLTLLAVACTSFYGCASNEPQFYPLNANNEVAFGQPLPADKVELFITNRPDYKYTELGIITYSVPSSFSNEIEVYTKIKQMAGDIGADAVIMMPPQSDIYQIPRTVLDYYGNPMPTEVSRSYVKFRGMAIAKTDTQTPKIIETKVEVKPIVPEKSVQMPDKKTDSVDKAVEDKTPPPLDVKPMEQSPQTIETTQ